MWYNTALINEWLGDKMDNTLINEILNKKLKDFIKKSNLSDSFNILKIYGNNNSLYKEQFNSLYYSLINSIPTTETFDNISKYLVNELWQDFTNIDEYNVTDIIGTIMSELRSKKQFSKIIDNLDILSPIKKAIGNKYDILYQSLKNYYDTYNQSNVDERKLEIEKNKIFKIISIYNSKNKECCQKEIKNNFHNFLKNYFKLNINNPYIYKKLIHQSKKEEFKNLYFNDKISDFINSLYEKYNNDLDYVSIFKIIFGFIAQNKAKISEIFDDFEPFYSNYEKYLKANKIIYRLNMHFINYDDNELNSYRNIITFDNNNGIYIYNGKKYNNKDKIKYYNLNKKYLTFEKIKRDITNEMNRLCKGSINKYIYDNLKNELPFTNQYFIFDQDYCLNKFTLKDLITACIDNCGFYYPSFTNNESYKFLYNFLINNGFFWLLLFKSDKNNYDNTYSIKKNDIMNIINDIENIINLSKKTNIDINNYANLLLLSKLSNADTDIFNIIDKDTIRKLINYRVYTYKAERKVLDMAKDLICHMAKRSSSTVPFVEGSLYNYKYSMYDYLDDDILLAGFYTNACFTIAGNNNDFLHYCALDKNGFVLKITNSCGNFIARASGYRRGNAIFINQLRTIYDRAYNECDLKLESEKKEIIETFIKACLDIIKTSHNNENEKIKIDYIFVTQSYILKDFPSNVSKELEEEIGEYPMDVLSDDWNNFIDTSPNLEEADYRYGFTTDYAKDNSNYRLIAISQNNKIIDKKDLIRDDVEALYERKRNKLQVSNINDNILKKIYKIKAIDNYFNKKKNNLCIPDNSSAIVGDNWFLIYDNNYEIINYCVLNFDIKAIKEFEICRNILERKRNEEKKATK